MCITDVPGFNFSFYTHGSYQAWLLCPVGERFRGVSAPTENVYEISYGIEAHIGNA